jgi:phosphatidylinositol glycan class B
MSTERWKTSRIFGLLLLFRISNAVLCTTAFHADEYFQSLEVAHKLVFGYGWTTWEWNPEVALRSPLFALLFVPGYWIVKVLNLGHTYALVSLDRLQLEGTS